MQSRPRATLCPALKMCTLSFHCHPDRVTGLQRSPQPGMPQPAIRRTALHFFKNRHALSVLICASVLPKTPFASWRLRKTRQCCMHPREVRRVQLGEKPEGDGRRAQFRGRLPAAGSCLLSNKSYWNPPGFLLIKHSLHARGHGTSKARWSL